MRKSKMVKIYSEKQVESILRELNNDYMNSDSDNDILTMQFETTQAMLKLVGAGREYTEGNAVKAYNDDFYSFIYIHELYQEGKINRTQYDEMVERNLIRLWEPYIGRFKEKVGFIVESRILAHNHTRYARLTAEQKELIYALYACGYGGSGISDLFQGSITYCVVNSTLKKEGLFSKDIRRGQVLELMDNIKDIKIKKYKGVDKTTGKKSYK